MSALRNPGHVLITGASSGISAALAYAYAAPRRRLALKGRNTERLETVVERCRNAGADCVTRRVDVTDAQAMVDWLKASDAETPIDLVIANAGISAGACKLGNAPDVSDAEIFTINVDGVIHAVEPMLARMRKRGAGQIAIMSSLASFRGFADAPAYCASKAAVRVYCEGLQRAHRGAAPSISVICPGFIRSPMTDANDFRMPLLMDAEPAARRIVRDLARGRALIAFPLPLYLGVRLLALF